MRQTAEDTHITSDRSCVYKQCLQLSAAGDLWLSVPYCNMAVVVYTRPRKRVGRIAGQGGSTLRDVEVCSAVQIIHKKTDGLGGSARILVLGGTASARWRAAHLTEASLPASWPSTNGEVQTLESEPSLQGLWSAGNRRW